MPDFGRLVSWYSLHGRDHLPWRRYDISDLSLLTYRVWLAETLLQQTQAERVIPFYEKILARYPTVHDLAHTSYEEFFPFYEGLGYYWRARRALLTAASVVQNHGGIFPNDERALLALPGVGPYTARAIRAFAYDESVLAWDANLEMIFSRYIHGSRYQKLSESERLQIEQGVKKSSLSGRVLNNALMDLGAAFARYDFDALPLAYPFADGCRWWQTRWDLEVRPLKKRAYFPLRDATILAIVHRDHQQYASLAWSYTPFAIESDGHSDHRSLVKAFFEKKYALKVSVRPVHLKVWSSDRPLVYCYVQIQSGDSSGLAWHEKSVYQKWLQADVLVAPFPAFAGMTSGDGPALAGP